VINAALLAVSGLLVLALFGIAAALTVVPAVVGGHVVTVLSGSMVPALRPGSIAVDRPIDPAQVRVGDIITYSAADPVSGVAELITHRVVAIGRDSVGQRFTTRGDANNAADEQPVRAAQIRGTVWYDLPYLGFVRGALRTGGVGLVAGAVVLLVAGGWLLRWSGWPGSRRGEPRARHRDRT
jgi:signal peptidase